MLMVVQPRFALFPIKFLQIFERILPAVIVPIFGAICQLSRGGAVHRQLDRSNLEITRPIPRPAPKLPALNTRTVSHHISPYLCICSFVNLYLSPVRYPDPSLNLPALNTHTVVSHPFIYHHGPGVSECVLPNSSKKHRFHILGSLKYSKYSPRQDVSNVTGVCF